MRSLLHRHRWVRVAVTCRPCARAVPPLEHGWSERHCRCGAVRSC